MPATFTDRVGGVQTSVAIKAPVRVATTANITLSGLQSIDGVTVAAGDRVLVKDQSSAIENGIYVASASDWARAKDFNGARDVVEGTQVLVHSGVTIAGTVFRLETSNPVIGSSTLAFRVSHSKVTSRPDTLTLAIYGDDQAKAADNPDNTYGHDMVAAQRAAWDHIRDNVPSDVLVHVGDVIDRYHDVPALYGSYTDDDLVADKKAWWSEKYLPQNQLHTAGNHDDDDDGTERWFKHVRHFGKKNFVVEYNDVVIIVMSTENGGTPGHVNDVVFRWWERTVRKNQDKFIITVTHHPLANSTAGAMADGSNSVIKGSDRFYNVLRSKWGRVDAWFSGHVGGSTILTDPANTDAEKFIYGTFFADVGFHIPGAYDAATGVPLWDMSLGLLTFTRGSNEVVYKRHNIDTGQDITEKTTTLTAQHNLYPTMTPTRDTRGQDEWQESTYYSETGDPLDILVRWPIGPDAGSKQTSTDTLNVTSGQSVLTVAYTAHGLTTNDYAWVQFDTAFGGIEPEFVVNWSPVTVVDANTFTVELSQAATSTASGGGNVTVALASTRIPDAPLWMMNLWSHEPSINHEAGETVGISIGVSGDGDHSNAMGFGGGIAVERAGGAEGDFSGIACIYASTSGQGEDSAVKVTEYHPTEGPKPLVGTFQYQVPAAWAVRNDDVDLATTASPYRPDGYDSAAVDVGGYINTSGGYFEGATDGEVWEFTANVSFKDCSAAGEDLLVELEHWDDSSGTTKTTFARSWISPDSTSGKSSVQLSGTTALGNSERVYVVISQHSGTTTSNLNRVEFGGKRISAGN